MTDIPPGWTQGGEQLTAETHPELFRVLREARDKFVPPTAMPRDLLCHCGAPLLAVWSPSGFRCVNGHDWEAPEPKRLFPELDKVQPEDITVTTYCRTCPKVPGNVDAVEGACCHDPERRHNRYCRDDWTMYRGDGPRGMGSKGDGCVCELAPEGYDD